MCHQARVRRQAQARALLDGSRETTGQGKRKSMTALTSILIHLFIMFAAAKLGGELFSRLRQPAVIGEVLAGMLIGPYALGLVGTPPAALVEALHGEEPAREGLHLVYHVIAELGVIVLLFYVGLETRLSDLKHVGWRAVVVGILGILLPFGLGLGFMSTQPTPQVTDMFVATALVATSVGITARVLRDLGVLRSVEARIILGAAVIDDILGMMLLAVVAAAGQSGEAIGAHPWTALAIGAQAVAFVIFVTLLGTRITRNYSMHLERLHVHNAPLVVALMVTLGLAALAGTIGLAAIIGAFLAGMVFAETREQYQLEDQVQPLYEFLVPFFFVVTGMQVDWRLFLDPTVIGIALVITAIAIFGKLIGCGLGALGLGSRSMAIVGVGMVPRGEVGLIVAGIGRSLGAISDQFLSVVVVMSVVTTLIVPPVLTALYRGREREPRPAYEEEGEPLEEAPLTAR